MSVLFLRVALFLLVGLQVNQKKALAILCGLPFHKPSLQTAVSVVHPTLQVPLPSPEFAPFLLFLLFLLLWSSLCFPLTGQKNIFVVGVLIPAKSKSEMGVCVGLFL